MEFERIALVPHLRTPFRFYSTDELDRMPSAALRDLEERVTVHRNKIRGVCRARSAEDPLASTDVLVAMIKREQDCRTRTEQSLQARRGESGDEASSSEGGR